MRWITSLRSLFFHEQSFQASIVRSFSRAVHIENDLKDNPYFEKYANKIAQVQQRSVEELKNSEAKAKDASQAFKKSNSAKLLGKTENKSHFQKQKDLNRIMKIESIQEKGASEIEDIWNEYHEVKDGAYAAVLPGDAFKKMQSNLEKYPVFLFPLPKNNGYEFIMCQHLDQSCYFTSLINYQAFQENAPVSLTITYFTELMETKGLVLIRGEYDNNTLNADDVGCLLKQLHLYYENNNTKRFQLVEQFNMHPSAFKHMDLIANLEQS